MKMFHLWKKLIVLTWLPFLNVIMPRDFVTCVINILEKGANSSASQGTIRLTLCKSFEIAL